jgi:hypothetical protein
MFCEWLFVEPEIIPVSVSKLRLVSARKKSLFVGLAGRLTVPSYVQEVGELEARI